MTLLRRIVQIILFIHGLLNIAQGAFGLLRPQSWAPTAGEGFSPSTDQALQSIGLGCIGVGVYSALGAWTNDQRFYVVTMIMRLSFAAAQVMLWGLSEYASVIAYELVVGLLAGAAALS